MQFVWNSFFNFLSVWCVLSHQTESRSDRFQSIVIVFPASFLFRGSGVLPSRWESETCNRTVAFPGSWVSGLKPIPVVDEGQSARRTTWRDEELARCCGGKAKSTPKRPDQPVAEGESCLRSASRTRIVEREVVEVETSDIFFESVSDTRLSAHRRRCYIPTLLLGPPNAQGYIYILI